MDIVVQKKNIEQSFAFNRCGEGIKLALDFVEQFDESSKTDVISQSLQFHLCTSEYNNNRIPFEEFSRNMIKVVTGVMYIVENAFLKFHQSTGKA